MNIIKDIDLINEYNKYDVILLGTNIYGILGNGLQFKMKKKFPLIHEKNIETSYGDPRKIGKYIVVDTTPIICLLYITKDYNYKLYGDTLDYKGLEKCLKNIKKEFDDKSIACTILGTSLFDGNGNRNKVLSIFNKINFSNITLYDYNQKSLGEENKEQYLELLKVKKVDRNKYYQLVKERKKRYKENGFF